MKHSDTLRQQLSVQRNVLKGQLLDRLRPILVQTSQTRVLVPRSIATIYSSNQLMGAECCYCWQWDNPESVRMDVHEIVFSRGSVQGAGDKAMLAIMDRRNCGFVHQKECHKMAEGGDGRLRAIMYLIRYEGYTNVLRFTRDMSGYVYATDYARDVNQAWDTINAMMTRPV